MLFTICTIDLTSELKQAFCTDEKKNYFVTAYYVTLFEKFHHETRMHLHARTGNWNYFYQKLIYDVSFLLDRFDTYNSYESAKVLAYFIQSINFITGYFKEPAGVKRENWKIIN